jgi:toxin ParE1/3/4
MADYIVTPNAEKDIDEILLFIAADNLEAAIAFNERLSNLFEMLADNTKMGRERPELKEGLRSFPEGSYLIFYREWAGVLAIVRVLHGSRDLEEMLS